MEPLLRPATPDDVPAITALVGAAYGPYQPLIGRTPMPMLVDYGDAVQEHTILVLEAASAIVGVIELIDREDHLWVENVAVAPAWQGRGLGRRLLRHGEDEARRLGRDQVGLLTNERYAANIAMYTRYGYRETHREPHLGTDLVYFRKALAPGGGMALPAPDGTD